MICWMFPGQPVSFGNPLQSDDVFRDIAETCLSITGFDPGRAETGAYILTESVRLQLFGLCCSIWKYRRLALDGRTPDFVTEHSMGIFPALVACNVAPVEDVIEMTFRAGVRMAEAFKDGSYSLGCVTGMRLPQISAIADNHGVYIANCNTSCHFLLSGSGSGIEAALLEAGAVGAYSVSTFSCDAPLHTPLMEVIADDLKGIYADYSYHEPAIPLIEHVSQQFLTASSIPKFLYTELCQPVQWEESYRSIRRLGVVQFIELGFGGSLTKFNRWIDSES